MVNNLANSALVGQIIFKERSTTRMTMAQQFEYARDDIGNRISTGGRASAQSSYNVNSRNQYTSRTVAGGVDIVGGANKPVTVTVNGAGTDYRRGEYWHKYVTVDNSVNPVWLSVNVTTTGGGSASGNVFIPAATEWFDLNGSEGHDADGNLLRDGRWDYTWDAENRLIRLVTRTTVGPPQRIEFEYDWKGRRIGKKVWSNKDGTGDPALTRKFLYDQWNLVAELDNNNAVVRSYVWGTDLSGSLQGAGGVGGLLMVQDAAQGTHFAAYDLNGNVIGLVKAADGTWSAQYEYGPFGEVIRMTGVMSKLNPFRFSTKYQDEETDLVYYGYRYYNPSAGRWLSRDPIQERGGVNLYGFTLNSPINYVDKDGQIIWFVIAAGAIYFGTEMFANAPGLGDPTYSGLTGDNVLAFMDLGIVVSAKLAQGLTKCMCKTVCSRLVPGGGLSAHETLGGHTLARHVIDGATSAQVEAALASRLAADTSIPAASAFVSRSVAEKAITEALEANQGAICAWLSGGTSRLVMTHAGSQPAGLVLARGTTTATVSKQVLVVLDKVAPQTGVCFRITTAYPK